MIGIRRTELLLLAFVIESFLVFFLVVIYPGLSDFGYWHMSIAIDVGRSGHIPYTHVNSGFYAMTAVLSEVSSVSYGQLPLLPLQGLPLVLLTICFLRRLGNHIALPYFVCLAIVVSGTNPLPFTWSVHNLGYLLFMSIAFLTLLMLRREKKCSRVPMLSCIVLSVVALNFVSYKLMFLAIVFLAALDVSHMLMKTERGVTLRRHVFARIAIVGLCLSLSLNYFVYNSLLPSLTYAYELQSYSGIYKLFAVFKSNGIDQLDSFYSHSASDLMALTIAYLAIVVIVVLLLSGRLAQLWIRGTTIGVGGQQITALCISGFLLVLVYSFLGYSDLTFVVFAGLSGIVILPTIFARKGFRIAVVLVLAIILINAATSMRALQTDFYNEQKDAHGFVYLSPSSEWYYESVIPQDSGSDFEEEGNSFVAYTDVFTAGYFMKDLSRIGINSSQYPLLLSREHLLFLLGVGAESTSTSGDIEGIFIVNYEETRFSIQGWEFYKSWSESMHKLHTLEQVNLIYSDGYVDYLHVMGD